MKLAQWKSGKRFDSSLQQSIWHCKAAMKSNNPAVLLDPPTARTLERRGLHYFWIYGMQGVNVGVLIREGGMLSEIRKRPCLFK